MLCYVLFYFILFYFIVIAPTLYPNHPLLYVILFLKFITSANTTYKLPEDGERPPKHVWAIII
jgi:hypothetical protein